MKQQATLSRISIDPEVCFGKPCIRGHRIWVSLVLDLLAGGMTAGEILREYPGLEEEDIRAAIVYGAETRHDHLVGIQRQLNEEVYGLYGISREDRAAIEAELAEAVTATAGNNAEEREEDTQSEEEAEGARPSLTREELARRWVSYTVGSVLGHFELGKPDGLGCGDFPTPVCKSLQRLVADRGILVYDEAHRDDLTRRTLEALEIMLGSTQAADVVRAAAEDEGPAEEVLRAYLKRSFFRQHIRMYRKRPVYWLLESPRRLYGLWLFHERLTTDTLLRINEDYLKPKIRRLESELKDVRARFDSSQGGSKQTLKKRRDEIIETLDDVREFGKRLEGVIQRGYSPHIDDGVLLNMAPLWELIPPGRPNPKRLGRRSNEATRTGLTRRWTTGRRV